MRAAVELVIYRDCTLFFKLVAMWRVSDVARRETGFRWGCQICDSKNDDSAHQCRVHQPIDSFSCWFTCKQQYNGYCESTRFITQPHNRVSQLPAPWHHWPFAKTTNNAPPPHKPSAVATLLHWSLRQAFDALGRRALGKLTAYLWVHRHVWLIRTQSYSNTRESNWSEYECSQSWAPAGGKRG